MSKYKIKLELPEWLKEGEKVVVSSGEVGTIHSFGMIHRSTMESPMEFVQIKTDNGVHTIEINHALKEIKKYE